MNTYYLGDCLEVMDKLEADSIDAIITDPPYELNFMGKGWDNAGISFNKETWAKCLRLLKPGGHLLAFGGSRTFHRIACAIEDAGVGALRDGNRNNTKPRRNTHATVKPTALMQYLVRLVVPRGGVILDPFMGSGSTGKAIAYENKDRNAGYSFIGIEQDEQYVEIAKARVKYVNAKDTTQPVGNSDKLLQNIK